MIRVLDFQQFVNDFFIHLQKKERNQEPHPSVLYLEYSFCTLQIHVLIHLHRKEKREKNIPFRSLNTQFSDNSKRMIYPFAKERRKNQKIHPSVVRILVSQSSKTISFILLQKKGGGERHILPTSKKLVSQPFKNALFAHVQKKRKRKKTNPSKIRILVSEPFENDLFICFISEYWGVCRSKIAAAASKCVITVNIMYNAIHYNITIYSAHYSRTLFTAHTIHISLFTAHTYHYS